MLVIRVVISIDWCGFQVDIVNQICDHSLFTPVAYGSTPIAKTQLLEYQLRQARPEPDGRLVLILSLW